MTEVLYDIVIDYVFFLELTSDDVLNPDVAVRQLEVLSGQIADLDERTTAVLLNHVDARIADGALTTEELRALQEFFFPLRR